LLRKDHLLDLHEPSSDRRIDNRIRQEKLFDCSQVLIGTRMLVTRAAFSDVHRAAQMSAALVLARQVMGEAYQYF
jgi:hypothetical protein